jgi:hypothetical protein
MKKLILLLILLHVNNFSNAQNMNDIEKNQLNKISYFLSSISTRMVEDIKGIFNEDYGLLEKHSKSDIEFYEFEVFEDGYRINFYPMDSRYNQLGFKKTLPEYPNGFLRDKDLDIDQEYYDFNNESDRNRMDEFYKQLSIIVLEWFNKCWKEAGGLHIDNKYSISIHDSNKIYDLNNQNWINN